MRSDHLDALLQKALIERIGVVCLVPDQTLWLLLPEKGARQSRLNKGDLVRASTLRVEGERNRSAV